MHIGSRSAFDDLVRANSLQGLGDLAGKRSRRQFAGEAGAHQALVTLKPELLKAISRAGSRLAQVASEVQSARSMIQSIESSYSDPFAMADSSATAELDDIEAGLSSDAQGQLESFASEAASLDVPPYPAPPGTPPPPGGSWGPHQQRFQEILGAVKDIEAKAASMSAKIKNAVRIAQQGFARTERAKQQEAQRIRAEEQRRIAQERAEEQRMLAEERRLQQEEDRRLRLEQQREQAAMAAEQRRAQMEMQREQQRAQMEAQFEAQRIAMEQQRAQQEAALEQQRLQAEFAASQPPPMPAMPAAPVYQPATTTTDVSYVDPTAQFAQLLPAAPQAMIVDPLAMQQTVTEGDWVGAESSAWQGNQGGEALWGLSGMGEIKSGSGTRSVAQTIRNTFTPENIERAQAIASSLAPGYIPPPVAAEPEPQPSGIGEWLTPTNLIIGGMAAYLITKMMRK